MEHPTTSTEERPPSPTREERMWPVTRQVMALVGLGVGWASAWHMSPLATTRTLMLAASQRVPADQRVEWATPDQARAAAFLNF